jgi:hypothetical protein
MLALNTPKRVLMATDLSARCDRALARSALLASAWHSELIVAHVVHAAEVARRDRLTSGAPSWRRPESWAQVLHRSLSADLEAEGIVATVRIVIGSPAEAVQQAVTDDEAGLVVLGIAKDARMDRIVDPGDVLAWNTVRRAPANQRAASRSA